MIHWDPIIQITWLVKQQKKSQWNKQTQGLHRLGSSRPAAKSGKNHHGRLRISMFANKLKKIQQVE